MRTWVVIVVAAAAVFLGPSAGASSGATIQVHIAGGAPNPAEATIDDGDFVTFVNDDDVEHAIFALGEQRGDPIPPHTTSIPYGPFHSENGGNTFPYRVDQDGAEGVINVRDGSPSTTSPSASSTSTSRSPTTGTTVRSTATSATPTTAPPAASATVAPPATPSTSVTTTSGLVLPAAPVVVRDVGRKNSPLLAGVGVALVAVGTAGLVYGSIRSRRFR